MTLNALIETLQAIAATTPDGGASLEVRAIYNDRGHCDEAFPVQDADVTKPEYLHGVNPCVVLSCK